ncbi:hypothetical protein F8M41_005584 [Gigaspora margarita]|uniref:Uncharacterized protein n=1 Tax=Gigaspora margarita TaxID=4874 RepID=A0A8H3XAX0_GIGMA|nr:hypothetical protein F8M41_005584 [Gigaspora margarita]
MHLTHGTLSDINKFEINSLLKQNHISSCTRYIQDPATGGKFPYPKQFLGASISILAFPILQVFYAFIIGALWLNKYWKFQRKVEYSFNAKQKALFTMYESELILFKLTISFISAHMMITIFSVAMEITLLPSPEEPWFPYILLPFPIICFLILGVCILKFSSQFDKITKFLLLP